MFGPRDYIIKVKLDGNEYMAWAPAFPSLSAFAPTRKAAVEECEGLIPTFIELLAEEGYEIPEPDAHKGGEALTDKDKSKPRECLQPSLFD